MLCRVDHVPFHSNLRHEDLWGLQGIVRTMRDDNIRRRFITQEMIISLEHLIH